MAMHRIRQLGDVRPVLRAVHHLHAPRERARAELVATTVSRVVLCQAKETGRSGDQKYLDEWPERFPGRVHVLRHQGWTLAPWNATRFPYGNALLYHFQGLRLLGRGRVSLGEHVLPPPVVRHVYEPYLDCLRQAIETLRREGFEFRPQAKRPGLLEDARRALSALVSPSWRYRTRYYRKL